MDTSTVLTVGFGALAAWQLSRVFLGKVAPAKAKALVDAGAKLIDVRSTGEHGAGHLRGSVNIPVHELGNRLAEAGAKDKPVVVYCASGVRSATAVSTLRRAGFTDVHDLGAMARWPG